MFKASSSSSCMLLEMFANYQVTQLTREFFFDVWLVDSIKNFHIQNLAYAIIQGSFLSLYGQMMLMF